MDNEFAVPLRKRGRPAGKNRVPLSQEEKRARNALYERERRTETAEAMAALAAAAGCNPGLSNADLIATVVNYIQNANMVNPSDDIHNLRRINQKLIMQIKTLELRLTPVSDLGASSSYESDERYISTEEYQSGRKKIKLDPEIKEENASPVSEIPYEVLSPMSAASSHEYYNRALEGSCTDISQLGIESEGSTEAHQAPWPPVEVLLDENTAGTLDCLRQWSIEDLLGEYLS